MNSGWLLLIVILANLGNLGIFPATCFGLRN